jgi:hypothetical protein
MVLLSYVELLRVILAQRDTSKALRTLCCCVSCAELGIIYKEKQQLHHCFNGLKKAMVYQYRGYG